MDTKCNGTLPWVSVERLNQANFPFFLSGKPAGVLPFTDKMVSVKYQEQDINREHAASDRRKKKTRNSAYTWHPLLSENFIMWITSTKLKTKVYGSMKYYNRSSEDNSSLLSAPFCLTSENMKLLNLSLWVKSFLQSYQRQNSSCLTVWPIEIYETKASAFVPRLSPEPLGQKLD